MSTIKRQRREYTPEFKRDAIALAEQEGNNAAKAARSLGINDNLIYKWRNELKRQNLGQSLSSSEREELKKLRQENKRLRMETEILKKASAYFAKEMK